MNFALIGAAGYIAPRHMKAIKDVGGTLVAALDPHDSVGVLDQYFPECAFFTEFERFDRHLSLLRREGKGVDYVSICSPNYLHDSHCRFALRIGADAICEKPLVLHSENLSGLKVVEEETGKRIWNILQLRYHPEVKIYNRREAVKIHYFTPRGKWYRHSWKGDFSKSGGLLTNIGIHLFDLALYMFGSCNDYLVDENGNFKTKGYLALEKAEVEFSLSIMDDEPERSLWIGENRIDLSNGFTDAHTKCYREILAGRGFGIEDVRPAISLVEKLKSA